MGFWRDKCLLVSPGLASNLLSLPQETSWVHWIGPWWNPLFGLPPFPHVWIAAGSYFPARVSHNIVHISELHMAKVRGQLKTRAGLRICMHPFHFVPGSNNLIFVLLCYEQNDIIFRKVAAAGIWRYKKNVLLGSREDNLFYGDLKIKIVVKVK